MTTHTHSSKKTVSHATHAAPATEPTPSNSSPPEATKGASAGSTVFAPPPPLAQVPAVPDGFVGTSGAEYRGVLPKAAQLVVLSQAVEELGLFTDYVQVLGTSAPSIQSITEAFDAGNQWSLMRVRTIAWQAYCLQQEGLAWIDVRNLMDQLQPIFEHAVQANAALGLRFPSLVKFFGAARSIAQKGVATRKANKKQLAEGKEPTKGQVGKKRLRAAERAAYIAAATSSPPQSPSPPGPSPQASASAPVTATRG